VAIPFIVLARWPRRIIARPAANPLSNKGQGASFLHHMNKGPREQRSLRVSFGMPTRW